MSNTYIVRESSERKAKFEEKIDDVKRSSKENYNLKSSGEDDDFNFG